MNAERDRRVSEIFYYFEKHTTLDSGRAAGRKIGVVQEVILRRYLERQSALRRRMFLEQSLRGRSGASHRVEFSWFAMESFEVGLGDEIPGTGSLRLVSVDHSGGGVRVGRGDWDRPVKLDAATRSRKLRDHLAGMCLDIRVTPSGDESIVADVLDLSRPLASLESKRVGAQRFSRTKKLGPGIQTIEKAKQAALAAVDLDLEYNGSVKPLPIKSPRALVSLVALGNGVHWTDKDLAVLGAYVDYVFQVEDSAIVRYADYVRRLWEAGGSNSGFLEYFMAYFQSMKTPPADSFEVGDDDFRALSPTGESRSLASVLAQHIERTNP